VLEAMAAARPVVGTAVGVEGIGFAPGRHGLVAEQPREIAAGLATLLADPAEAERLGAAGRALAEEFRWPRALAELEATYAEWVATARKFGRAVPMTP
jgi:glycosyltransferase involved in cell wall biosynthesis